MWLFLVPGAGTCSAVYVALKFCWYRVQVHADAQRVGRKAAEANVTAAECHASLEIAYPALTAAEEALNVLTKADMAELKVRPHLQRYCLSTTRPSLKTLREDTVVRHCLASLF